MHQFTKNMLLPKLCFYGILLTSHITTELSYKVFKLLIHWYINYTELTLWGVKEPSSCIVNNTLRSNMPSHWLEWRKDPPQLYLTLYRKFVLLSILLASKITSFCFLRTQWWRWGFTYRVLANKFVFLARIVPLSCFTLFGPSIHNKHVMAL